MELDIDFINLFLMLRGYLGGGGSEGLASLFEEHGIMRLIVMVMFVFLLCVGFAQAAPVLYSGEIVVKKVSGKACKSDYVGKVYLMELAFERFGRDVSGYVMIDGRNSRKFRGPDGAKIVLTYPTLTNADGHTMEFAVQGDALIGSLHEKHLADDAVDDCNWDDAEFKLYVSSGDTSLFMHKAEAGFNSKTAREQGLLLYRQGKYAEALPLLEKALTLQKEVQGNDDSLIADAVNYREENPAPFAGAKGLMILKVQPRSQGEKIGLSRGDIIIGYGTSAVDSAKEFIKLVTVTAPNTKVELLYLHNGEGKRAIIDGGKIGIELQEITYKEGDTSWIERTKSTEVQVKGKHDDEIVSQLKRAIKLKPDDFANYYQLGLIYESNNDYTNALMNFRRAIGLKPEDAKSLIATARLFIKTGHLLEAENVLETAKQTDSGGEASALLEYIHDRLRPRLVEQSGHVSGVESVAVSPDGKFALSGGRDQSLKLWNLATGKVIRTFKGHNMPVQSVAFSPDGVRGISRGDFDIKVWSLTTGKNLLTINTFPTVNCIAISPDGRTVLAGSTDNNLTLWDLATGKMLRIFRGHTGEIVSVAISKDGQTALSGSHDKTLKLWSLTTGRLIKTFQEGSYVTSVAISPDGMTALSGSYDNTVKHWDLETGNILGTLVGHDDTIGSVVFSVDGKTALSTSKDILKYWDLSTCKEFGVFHGHTSKVNSVVFCPDGKTALSGSDDETLKVWELATGRVLQTLQGLTSKANAAAISHDGKTVILGHSNTMLSVWNLAAGVEPHTLRGHISGVTAVAFSVDGKTALSGSHDGSLKLWDIDNGTVLRTFVGHMNTVTSVAISPDGKTVLSGSEDKTLKLWDLTSGQELRTFQGHKALVDSIAISPDGRYALSGSRGFVIKLWDLVTGKELRTFEGHTFGVKSVAFSPDGRTVLSGSKDSTLKLWDTATGKELLTLDEHTSDVFSVAYSPDGKTALSGSRDKTLKLWDLTTGKELRTFGGHTSMVMSVAFSPDGATAISASWDSSVILWNVATGRWLAKLFYFAEGTWAVVDPEGRFDASNGGNVQGLHWVVNNEPIELAQLKERYYEPGLLAKIMSYNKEPLRPVNAFTSVALFPEIKVNPPSDKNTTATISLKNRGGGIGKVRVLVNGKEIAADARGPKHDADAKTAELSVEIPETLLIPSKENTIQVLAWNKEGYLSSRGEPIRFTPPSTKKAEPVTLHAIVIGISKYADPKMNLTFSGKDAADMATALSISAKRLFGAERVDLKLLTDDTTNPAAIPPTRDNIAKAFADAAKSTSADVLVVYMAGHGVMVGSGDESEYYYLTPEARSTDLSDPAIRKQYGITSSELTEWIKKIPALKQVMVLDTCAAGGAAAKLVEKRSLSSDQIRSLERLKDRTGFHVLMGAAADKQSLEASRYGQGLLTYALLQGIKGAALRDDQSVDVQKLFQYAADEVPKLAGSVGGIQRPLIASPLGASFDIGLLTTADKQLIPLATVKPMILKAAFQDAEELDDTLFLGKQVNSRLREQAARLRGSQLVYVDADELPGAWRMTGRYQREGDKITVKVVMREGKNKKDFSMQGKADDLAGLAATVLDRAQELLLE